MQAFLIQKNRKKQSFIAHWIFGQKINQDYPLDAIVIALQYHEYGGATAFA